MALKVQAVISSWKSINLQETQRKIDEVASEIATEQDESENSKKKLIELSREFKRSTPEDVRKQVAPLLKSFQLEIDNLNKRNKFAESAFLNIYKQVIEMPDPLPALDYCVGLEKKVGKFADLEIENKNLRETLHEYNEEFKEVRNQDVTIKTLKEKIKNYEEQLEDSVDVKIKELEKELSRDYLEKEKLLQEMQESAMKRLQESESQTQILQQSLNQAQSELFDYKSKFDESNAARSDETEMLMNDYERANLRAIIAEKEVAQLKEQIQFMSIAHSTEIDELSNSTASITEVEASSNLLSLTSLENEVATKDKEIAQLVNDIKELQLSLDNSNKNYARQINSLEESLDEKTQLLKDFEHRVTSQKDYEEIKRELKIIKSIEFGVENNEISNESLSSQKPLEVLLLEKNKSLQNENTILKQSNNDLSTKANDSEQEIVKLQSLVIEQKGLITQLESDLSSVHTLSTMYRGEGEGSASMPEIVAEAVRSSTSSTPPLLQSRPTSYSPVQGGSPPDFTSAAESLLPIVSSQRERFRQRNEELEADVASKGQQVILLQNELDSLRADNLKLYEKIRFLQSYQGQSKNDNFTAESRYSSQYEEGLDPFSSFSRKEKIRKYASLSPFEKITLSLGRFILGNKTARTVTFMYTAMVHCLVFLVLYKLAHTESCKRDFASDCSQRFAEHMQQVHGHSDGQHSVLSD